MSSHAYIRKTFEEALAAVDSAIEIAHENVKFTPQAAKPFQEVYLLTGEPENPTMGRGFYREVGIFQVTLRFPFGSGPGAAEAHAEAIRAYFYKGRQFTNGSVTLTIQRTPQISQGAQDGDRWAVPVRVRYFANVSL